MKNNQFAMTLKIIFGILTGSTIAVLALANVLISDADLSQDTAVQGGIEDRIRPIAGVDVENDVDAGSGIEIPPTDTAKPMQVADSSPSVEKLYMPCSACHATGLLNAPKLGDKAGWQPRIAKGIDQLYANAINGIGTMPPKGGSVGLSDEDVKKIVDYMLESVQ